MKAKRKNLQPWIDYFRLLQRYEEKGFLDVLAEKHEAYVTQPALITLASDYDLTPTDDMTATIQETVRETPRVLRRIRTYAGWKSREGTAYMRRPFALHVVKPDVPHDLICTLLVTRRRRWWMPWTRSDRFDLIGYKA